MHGNRVIFPRAHRCQPTYCGQDEVRTLMNPTVSFEGRKEGGGRAEGEKLKEEIFNSHEDVHIIFNSRRDSHKILKYQDIDYLS